MDNLIVFILCGILMGTLLPESASGQWYKELYGVEDIKELNENQLNIALFKAKREVKRERTTTILGASAATLGGLLLYSGIKYFINPPSTMWLGNASKVNTYNAFGLMSGGLIFGVGVIFAVDSGIQMRKAKIRISEIEKTLGNTISRIHISPSIIWIDGTDYLGATLLIPIL